MYLCVKNPSGKDYPLWCEVRPRRKDSRNNSAEFSASPYTHKDRSYHGGDMHYHPEGVFTGRTHRYKGVQARNHNFPLLSLTVIL